MCYRDSDDRFDNERYRTSARGNSFWRTAEAGSGEKWKEDVDRLDRLLEGGDDQQINQFFEERLDEVEDQEEDAAVLNSVAQRFYEISQEARSTQFEHSPQFDDAIQEIERQFFFGKLKRKFKKFAKKFGKKLLKKGFSLLKKAVGGPLSSALSVASNALRGNLKGALGGLIKSAAGALIPGGPLVTAALGMEASQLSGSGKEYWRQRAVQLANGYEQLAEDVVDRLEELADVRDSDSYRTLSDRLIQRSISATESPADLDLVPQQFAQQLTRNSGVHHVSARRGDEIVIRIRA